MNKTTTLVSKVRHVKKSTEPCLYTLLNLPARGTPENLQLAANDIRRAYRLAALDFHPDKNPTEEAAQAFLLIGDAYRVLSDPEKKREYDRTGRLDLGTLGREATTRSEDWMEVFRNMFDEVSSEEVADFYSTYIGSEDEVEDTLRAYELCKGDFVAMVTRYCMFPNEPGHVERLHEICKNLIKTKKVKENAAFRTSTLTESLQRIEEYLNRERVLAEAEARKFQQTASASRKKRGSGLKDAGALTLFSDQNKFESFLDALSTKYENLDANKKRTSRKRKDNQS